MFMGRPRPIHEKPHDRLQADGTASSSAIPISGGPESLTSEAVRIIPTPASSGPYLVLAGKPDAADLARKSPDR